MHEFVTYQDNWSPSGELEIATELKEKLLERRKDAARAAARKIHARTGGGGDAAPPGPTPALPSEVLAEIFYIVSRDTSPDVGLRNVLPREPDVPGMERRGARVEVAVEKHPRGPLRRGPE